MPSLQVSKKCLDDNLSIVGPKPTSKDDMVTWNLANALHGIVSKLEEMDEKIDRISFAIQQRR